jgi:hypothetical protein
MLDNIYLRREAGVEALGWAEDRKLELKVKAEELAATTPWQDQVMKSKAITLLDEVDLLLKIVDVVLVLVCVLLVVKK